MLINEIINALIFILPAYFANAAPIIFKTGNSRLPMDYGMKFYDSKRILGKGKTWTGFFIGIITGTFIGIITWLTGISRFYPDFETNILVAFLLSLGTMIGDAIGSFIKRRANVRSGSSIPILDQLSFLFVALLFASPFIPKEFDSTIILILMIITVIVHYTANIIAYKLKLKKVPW